MTEIVIWFCVALGLYFVGLGVYSLVRYLKAKKKVKKELDEKHED